MITKICYINSIGSFQNFKPETNLNLVKFNLFYGDNGSGKSTFTSILRSLKDANSDLIIAKKSIPHENEPQCQLMLKNSKNENLSCTFKDKNWNKITNYDLKNIIIFDDLFVENNIFTSFKDPNIDHARNQYQLIFGETGVGINNEKEKLKIEKLALNNSLERTEKDFKETYHISIKDYQESKIDDIKDLNEKLEKITQLIKDAKGSMKNDNSALKEIPIPFFTDAVIIDDIFSTLQENIDSKSHLDAKEKVLEYKKTFLLSHENSDHFLKIGTDHTKDNICPLCHNSFDLDLLDIYKNYFDSSYKDFIHKLEQLKKSLCVIPENYKNDLANIQLANQKCQNIWQNSIPELDYTRQDFFDKLDKYNNNIETIASYIDFKIKDTVKNDLPPINSELESDIKKIINIQNKSIIENNKKISDYETSLLDLDINEKNKEKDKLDSKIYLLNKKPDIDSKIKEYQKIKPDIELKSDEIRSLDERLKNELKDISDEFLTEINSYLTNENFTVKKVDPKNHVGYKGIYCDLVLEFNKTSLPIYDLNKCSKFHNIFSAGEKRSLAFAFFLATITCRRDLVNKVLVFDDPISSLDYNRKVDAANNIVELNSLVGQILVLTHDKTFFTHYFEKLVSSDLLGNEKLNFYRFTKNNITSKIEKQEESQINDLINKEHHEVYRKLVDYCNGGSEGDHLNNLRKLFEDLLYYKYPESCNKITKDKKTVFTAKSFEDVFVKDHPHLEVIFEELKTNRILEYTNKESHSSTSNSVLSDNEKKSLIKNGLEIFRKL